MRFRGLLNLSSLANDCGITHNTAKAWLSILEAGFLVFLLPPYFKNFNKRLKKSPKIYFYDSGLLCYLLGITKPEEIISHAMRGAIFEAFVLSELMKKKFNHGSTFDLFFWQDKLGREVDVLIEKRNKPIAMEIKSGLTVTDDYFQTLLYWLKLAKVDPVNAYVVYAGETSQRREQANVLSWTDLDKFNL